MTHKTNSIAILLFCRREHNSKYTHNGKNRGNLSNQKCFTIMLHQNKNVIIIVKKEIKV